MLLIGCTPRGRHIEQHDMYFGIGDHISDLIPDIISFWPEAKGDLHIDAWREIKNVDDYVVEITDKKDAVINEDKTKLFFINLGGYKENEFEEYHYKIVTAAKNKGEAVHKSKQTAFYKHYGFKGVEWHIDDKYGIDVDEIYEIEDIVIPEHKEKYQVVITKENGLPEDEIHLGYLKLNKL